jgi:hypothetical protein
VQDLLDVFMQKGADMLFDPTVFDNLKVVIEGSVYDLDAAQSIVITGRMDRVDLSVMSREFIISFAASMESKHRAEIRLHTGLRELAAEILDEKPEHAGCTLEVRLETQVLHPELDCPLIEKELMILWDHRPSIVQTLSYKYGEQEGYTPRLYNLNIVLHFHRQVNEEQIEDLPSMIDYAVASLQRLGEMYK